MPIIYAIIAALSLLVGTAGAMEYRALQQFRASNDCEPVRVHGAAYGDSGWECAP